MRVIQVDSGREWRGGQNQVRLLCRELAHEPGVENFLITKEDSELAHRALEAGVHVVGVPWAAPFDPRPQNSIHAHINAFAPAIVHAHDSHSLRAAIRARAHKASDDLPVIVASRRVDFPSRRAWLTRLFFGPSPWALATRIIAVSDAIKRVLVADGIAAAEIAIVPDGIDPVEVQHAAARALGIRARLGLPPLTPLAVNVAALVDHKDQRTLIRAAQHARAARADLHWAIAGDGPLRGSLAQEIARLDLRDRVHLLGYVEAADALIREADVFVMSSREEGLGSVILNALALDKPVVATAAGGIPEILPPEALVSVGDAEALATKVLQALDHPSRVPLPARFTARAMAQGVLAVYRSLL